MPTTFLFFKLYEYESIFGSMAGKLYTYPDNFRAAKARIAAQYSGTPIEVVCQPPDFVLGTTNKTPEFLAKFPLGKVPAFECADGTPIYESNAIAYYLANDELRGGSCKGMSNNRLSATLVQQYINFSDNEILPSACTWTFPTLGIMQYNKQNTEAAQAKIKAAFDVLDKILATRTFMVGERVTLADISLVCNMLLLFVQVLDPAFRKPYTNVTRWFVTCVNQPQFKAVLGEVKLCEKMATFDAKKYNELFPKEKGKKESKKEPKSKEQKKETKKETPKKKEPEPEEEDDKPLEPAKKFVDPYADLPKSSFVLDAFKRCYSNEDTATKAIPYFWENYDKEGWSIWKAVYNYNDDLKKIFMSSNLVSGMFQRLDKFRKYGFASVLILGENDNNCIEGVWVMRGQELAFSLVEDWNIDAASYTFSKLDPDNETDRETVNKFFLWEGDFGGKEVADGKIFK